MPNTMASWFSDTRRPRIRAGAISAIYMGDVIEAAPTPTPPSMRKTTNQDRLGGIADPIAETRNMAAHADQHLLAPEPVTHLARRRQLPARSPPRRLRRPSRSRRARGRNAG